MKAGFYTADITMPIGYEMAGGYLKAFSQRIMGPLKIRAAVFSDGKAKTAFAVVDTSSFDDQFVVDVLAELKNRCKLEFDATLLASSHVHTGGLLRKGDIPVLKEMLAPEIFDRLETASMPARVECYYWMCISHCASAIAEAYYRMEDAQISVGRGHEAGRIFNRRLRLKDGREYTHPGKMNPDIVDFAGPVDPDVNVLGAWREDGSLIGCLINYGCHGTTMCGTQGSHGDWFQFTDEVIHKLLGEDVGTVILNGPCGDVTQVNNLSPENDFGERVARELGGRVGAEAYKVLLSSPKRDDATLDFAHKIISIPKRKPSQEHVRAAVEKLMKALPSEDEGSTFARNTVIADALCRKEPLCPKDITAIRIGDAAIVSCQAELFCQLGLDLKAKSKFPFTFICTLANGSTGYVPTLKAFDPATGGGYETRLTPGRLDIHAGDILVDNSAELLNSLTEQPPPKPVEFTPRKLWSYGANRPELD